MAIRVVQLVRMPLDVHAFEPAVASGQRRVVGRVRAMPVRHRRADRLTEFIGSLLHVSLLDDADGKAAGACIVVCRDSKYACRERQDKTRDTKRERARGADREKGGGGPLTSGRATRRYKNAAYSWIIPPSITISVPTIKPDSGAERCSTVAAISLELPKRPSGICALI